jgi:hypothetical protein
VCGVAAVPSAHALAGNAIARQQTAAAVAASRRAVRDQMAAAPRMSTAAAAMAIAISATHGW